MIKHDLLADIFASTSICEKVTSDEVYCQHLYAAVCFNSFTKRETWPLLSGTTWSIGMSFLLLHSQGIHPLAALGGFYSNYDFSGIKPLYYTVDDEEFRNMSKLDQEYYFRCQSCVHVGTITDEIANDLYSIDWIVAN